jgi:Transcriptional regulator
MMMMMGMILVVTHGASLAAATVPRNRAGAGSAPLPAPGFAPSLRSLSRSGNEMVNKRFHLAFADLTKLRVFVTIAERGGLSAAADELGVSLTTVSRALTDLEIRLGMKLCTRGRGGFSLTAQGGELFTSARQLLEDVGTFETSVNRVSAVLRGRIRIGIIDNVISGSDFRLVKAMAGIRAAFPQIFPEVYMLQHGSVEEAVKSRAVDVGITPDPGYFRSLDYTEVLQEITGLYVAAGTELDAKLRRGAPLSELPYIRRRHKAAAYQRMETMLDLDAGGLADGLEAAAMLVGAGVGIGFLPFHYVEQFPPLRLRRVEAEGTPFQLSLYSVTRAGAAENPAAARFVRLLKEADAPAQAQPPDA